MDRPHFPAATTLAGVATLFALAACSGSERGVDPRNPGAPNERLVVTVTPALDTLPVGLTALLDARVTDALGAPQPVAVSWSSLEPSVATVSGGTVTALGAGTARIVATQAQAADTAVIVVTSDGVHLQVTPGAVSASAGDTLRFAAQLVSASGGRWDVPGVDWSATDSTAANLSGDGQLALNGAGELGVTARVGGMSATAQVSVFPSSVGSVTVTPSSASTAVGGAVDLKAVVRDQNGRVMPAAPVRWSTSSAVVASVDQSGHVVGIARGGVIITATSRGKSGTATVNVASRAASQLTLVLDPDTITVGFALQATATPLDGEGRFLPGRPIAYQSSNPSVATVNSAGVITALVAGATNISAICDGKIATQALVVETPRVAHLDIVPAAASVTQGSQATLVADVRDQVGRPMANVTVAWTSQAPTIVSITPAGVVSGLQLGAGQVTASAGGLVAQGTVNVVSQPVASVRVSPSPASVVVGQSTTLTATAFDAGGQPISGATFTWLVADATVASVSPLGDVTGTVPGTTTVTATSGGQSGSATVTVATPAPAPVASVSVSLNSPSLTPGQSTQATATLYDAAGAVLTGRPVTWASADTTLATVSPNGLVTAIAPGSASISATSEGQTGLATVTVAAPPPAPVASVTVTAPSTDLVVPQTAQLTVVLRDAQGNVLTGRTLAYSSSNSAVATVSPSGLVTALAAGSATITVASGGVAGTLTFAVSSNAPPAVASIAVTLASASLTAGQTTQATAEARDAQGNVVPGVTFTWTTSSASVATVSPSGVVSAVAAGSATISANAAGVVGSAGVTVTVPVPVVTAVDVSVNSAALTTGQTTQATAVARDAKGNVVPNVAFSWSVSSSAVLSVTSTGLVTAVASGVAQVRATAAGVSGDATITVSTAPAPAPWMYCVPAGNVCLFTGLRDVRLVASNGASVSQLAFHIVPCAIYGFQNRNPGPGPLFCDYGPVKTTTLTNPMPGMGGLPAVVTVPLGAPGENGPRTTPTGVAPVPAGSGSFRTQCSLAKFAFDDPIVYPGQPGASHLHMFFGNTGVTASSTNASLVATGNSTCRGGTLNRTAYWMPAVYDSRTGEVQLPDEGTFYYKTGYGMDPKTIQPMPVGLRMIAGDKNATAMQPHIDWMCMNGSGGAQGSIPTCRVGDVVRLTLIFPQCWDGKNLDAADHKSHMTYPTYRNYPQLSTCPSTHPVPVPEMTEHFDFPVTAGANPAYWRLTSDMYTSSLPGGFSAHADWMNGWDQTTMVTFVTQCLNKSLDCGVGSLGNGWDLY